MNTKTLGSSQAPRWFGHSRGDPLLRVSSVFLLQILTFVCWPHLLAQMKQYRRSLGSELEKSCSRVLGYCVRCVRLPACACVRACSCVCACKGGTVILPVTRCTQSLPAPPAFLRSSIYHLRVDPGQTGSEVQRRGGLNRKRSLRNSGKAGP